MVNCYVCGMEIVNEIMTVVITRGGLVINWSFCRDCNPDALSDFDKTMIELRRNAFYKSRSEKEK